MNFRFGRGLAALVMVLAMKQAATQDGNENTPDESAEIGFELFEPTLRRSFGWRGDISDILEQYRSRSLEDLFDFVSAEHFQEISFDAQQQNGVKHGVIVTRNKGAPREQIEVKSVGIPFGNAMVADIFYSSKDNRLDLRVSAKGLDTAILWAKYDSISGNLVKIDFDYKQVEDGYVSTTWRGPDLKVEKIGVQEPDNKKMGRKIDAVVGISLPEKWEFKLGYLAGTIADENKHKIVIPFTGKRDMKSQYGDNQICKSYDRQGLIETISLRRELDGVDYWVNISGKGFDREFRRLSVSQDQLRIKSLLQIYDVDVPSQWKREGGIVRGAIGYMRNRMVIELPQKIDVKEYLRGIGSNNVPNVPLKGMSADIVAR